MPNQFFSPEGDIENYFVTEYWLIDQYIGDELWTWGYGNEGLLGNAQITNRSTPVTTFSGGTNWKQVDCGFYHAAAIKTDGTLWTWGYGGGGRLGNALTSGNRSTPVTTFSGGTNWKQVSCGDTYGAAIKTDGTLWTWGIASNGRLGNGATTGNISTPVTTFAGGTNWKQVSCANGFTAAIKTDGTLWTWGNGAVGRLGNGATTGSISTPVTTFAGGTNWKQVSANNNSCAAVKTDGTLWTWGQGNVGQLGNTSTSNVSTPVTTFAGGTNWKQVACGFIHTVAIKTDGTLWVWGYNLNGNLGNAVTTNTSTPVTTFAGGNNWKQVTGGDQHTAAIKTDGTLWIWGNRTYGQLGDTFRATTITSGGSMNASSNTVSISTTGLAIGDKVQFTSPTNNNVNGATILSIGSGTVTLSLSNSATFYSGTFTFLRSISGTSTPVTTFAGGTNWKQVSGGEDCTIAIKTDGTLWGWGTSGYAQLGNGLISGVGDSTVKKITFGVSTPVTTFAGGTNWKQVSTSSNNTSALTYDDPVI